MDVAEQGEWAHNGNPLGVTWHEDHRVVLVQIVSGALGAPQEHEHFAFGAACAADVPLVPVDDVIIPVAKDRRADVRRIAARHSRLRHGIGAADAPLQQWFEPLLLLCLGAELLEHLHVASVGGRAIHRNVAKSKGTEDLADGRVLEDAQLSNLGQEEVVQATRLRLCSELHGYGRRRRPDRVTGVGWILTGHRLAVFLDLLDLLAVLPAILRRVRNDILLDEIDDLLPHLEEVRAQATSEGLKLRWDLLRVQDVAHRMLRRHCDLSAV
mmetsp:Transcript_46668/g.101827  ORF Transcript_46668/g.101827 Transcript_46668/m.101827 type:complete len:269 (+) Transcript_46668:734-1540(+)